MYCSQMQTILPSSNWLNVTIKQKDHDVFVYKAALQCVLLKVKIVQMHLIFFIKEVTLLPAN